MTDPTRTLCDLGAVCDADVVERAMASALRRGLTSVKRLEWRCGQLARPGRSGPNVLRHVLRRRRKRASPTESDLETLYLQVLRDHGVPEPVRQYEIRRNGVFLARVDLAYPGAETFVELDGWEKHRSREAFVHDRRRQTRIVAATNWHPLVFTWDDVVDHPERTAAQTDETVRRRRGRRGGAAR